MSPDKLAITPSRRGRAKGRFEPAFWEQVSRSHQHHSKATGWEMSGQSGNAGQKTKTHEHPPDQRACSRTGMTAPGNSRSGIRSLTDFSSEELNSLVPHV